MVHTPRIVAVNLDILYARRQLFTDIENYFAQMAKPFWWLILISVVVLFPKEELLFNGIRRNPVIAISWDIDFHSSSLNLWCNYKCHGYGYSNNNCRSFNAIYAALITEIAAPFPIIFHLSKLSEKLSVGRVTNIKDIKWNNTQVTPARITIRIIESIIDSNKSNKNFLIFHMNCFYS